MVERSTELPTRYPFPSGVDIHEVERCLEELGRVSKAPWRDEERLLADSFDWRLYDAGFVLEQQNRHDEGYRIVLRNRHTEEECGSLPEPLPRFAGDLPEHPLQQRLATMLKMRALLPLATLHSHVRDVGLLDDNDKTVVRIHIEQLQAGKPGNKRLQKLGNRLCIVPVKGYADAFARAHAHLRSTLGLQDEIPATYDASFAAAGCSPLDYSSKLDIQLAPGMASTVAVAKILRNLLATMRKNVHGIVNDIDSEYLHDFRVAVRRTRSAINQLKEAIAPRDAERFREEFAWLGSISSPVRDLDVYLLQFDEYRHMLDVDMRDHLDPLQAFLVQKRNSELTKLQKNLHSTRYRKIKRDWHKVIEARLTEPVAPEEYDRPALELASRRIGKLFERALREGQAIDADSPNEELHELRKTCKKLRYLLEFFANLYDDKVLAKQVRSLKKLQDNLGEFQDLTVQIQWLHAVRQEMLVAGLLSEPTGRAMDMLAIQLHKHQHKARKKFAARFERFADKQNRRQMQQMLKGKGA